MLPFLKRVVSFAKKAFIVLAVYFIIISLFFYFISEDKPKATVDPIKKNRAEIYKIINDKKFDSNKDAKTIVLLYRVVMCGMIGEGCTDNPNDGDKNFEQSMFGFVTNLIVLPYANPPASGVYWVYSGLQNAGFVPKTYAAEGIGFAGIKPLLNIWKVFRDFAYLLLVIILIAIGFMVMFRTKISQQAVISVENALPRIIFSLLLITFSFAIAGFLIDLMYITILVSISIISRANVGPVAPSNLSDLQNKFIGAKVSDLWTVGSNPFIVGSALVEVLPVILKRFLKGFVALAVANILGIIVTQPASKFFDNFKGIGGSISALTFGGGFTFGNLSGWGGFLVQLMVVWLLFPHAAGILVGILFSFTLLFLFFRIFFLLLTSYIKALLLIIFAPLILLFAAIPGRKALSFWLKNLIAELSVFPLVIILMLVGTVLVNLPLDEGRLFRAPFLFNIDPEVFAILIGTGLVLMIPNLIKTVKEALGAKGLPGGFGFGMFFAGVGAPAGLVGGVGSRYYQYTGLKQLFETIKGGRSETAKRVAASTGGQPHEGFTG